MRCRKTLAPKYGTGFPSSHQLVAFERFASIRIGNRSLTIGGNVTVDFSDHTIHCDPDWIEHHFNQQKHNVRVYLIEDDSQIVGAVPFVLSHKPLLCKLGESIVAKFPMRMLTLQGYTPNMPEETSLYDALFTQLLQSAPHAIELGHVPTASFLWNYLHHSELIEKSFSLYSQFGPLPHPLIHLTGSFESYIGKFSPKARKNRLREIKRLRAAGDMQFIRVTKASEIDAFLEAAHAISERTWQFLRHRWGISARDFDQVRSEMYFLANRGWLRGYLLKCGNSPCSFIIGQQYGQTLYTAAAGVHPAWRSYSAGTVLLLLVLEDLFKESTVQFYDLGDHAKYKEHFANESYQEASVWLFSRRPYPRVASGVFRSCNSATTHQFGDHQSGAHGAQQCARVGAAAEERMKRLWTPSALPVVLRPSLRAE